LGRDPRARGELRVRHPWDAEVASPWHSGHPWLHCTKTFVGVSTKRLVARGGRSLSRVCRCGKPSVQSCGAGALSFIAEALSRTWTAESRTLATQSCTPAAQSRNPGA